MLNQMCDHTRAWKHKQRATTIPASSLKNFKDHQKFCSSRHDFTSQITSESVSVDLNPKLNLFENGKEFACASSLNVKTHTVLRCKGYTKPRKQIAYVAYSRLLHGKLNILLYLCPLDSSGKCLGGKLPYPPSK